jgi:hypothetical protein
MDEDCLCGGAAIKNLIREQAGHRCLRCGHPYPPGIADTHQRGEWTPCDEHCTHGEPIRSWHPQFGKSVAPIMAPTVVTDLPTLLRNGHEVEAQWRILTVHHLDEDKRNCRWWNLAALCQRCHLRMQRAVVMDRVYSFEHSDWFKPYAAGFYAWKYEQEDLTREEIMERLDYYLDFEHRFTQEAIF